MIEDGADVVPIFMDGSNPMDNLGISIDINVIVGLDVDSLERSDAEKYSETVARLEKGILDGTITRENCPHFRDLNHNIETLRILLTK